MTIRIAPLLLVGAVVGAAGFAIFHTSSSPSAEAAPSTASPMRADMPLPGSDDGFDPQAELGGMGASDPHGGGALPPNHPAINSASPHGGAMGMGGLSGGTDEPAVIAWKAPDTWKSAPNPNSMRLETYKVPAAGGDGEDAELAISRAGGSTDANIDRWVGQFEEAGKPGRVEKKVSGFKITVVDINGTYKNASMMSDEAAAPKKNWSFVGAIVETDGSSYFFKLTGPAATIKAARPRFDAMIDGIKPATGSTSPKTAAAGKDAQKDQKSRAAK